MSDLTPSRPLSDERELKLLIQQMNRALRDSQGGGLMERFEAISKLLLTKIVDEREVSGTWPGSPGKAEPELSPSNGEPDRMLYERGRAVWQRTVSAHSRIFVGSRGRFPADVAGVAKILRLLAAFNLSATPNDIKGGAYEEILRNTFEKNENQQFFTPRHVVDFMVELCNPSGKEATCDPACGSGGFLVGALAFVAEHHGHMDEYAERVRGAEVDDRMAWVARINMLMHGGVPTSVRHLGGPGSLAPLSSLKSDLPSNSFDLILTNPPFGSDMTDREALDSLDSGRGRSSRRRGLLFLERCIDLLKPGGRLAIVLDDSALNLKGNADVRTLVRQRSVIEAVISLPDVTFMPYSTAKSSILVLRRRLDSEHKQGAVLMADVDNVGNRPNGDPLYAEELDENGHRQLKSDLPTVLSHWAEHQAGSRVAAAFAGTTVFSADINEYEGEPDGDRLDVFYFHPMRHAAEQRLERSTYDLVPLETLVEVDGSTVVPAEEFGDAAVRWIGLGEIEALTGRFDVKNVPGNRLKSNAHIFRPGDVLHSRLRPKLRKTVVVPPDDEGGLCSGELLVLRVRDEAQDILLTQYLAHLLRSDLAFGQVIYRVTGIGRPRVSRESTRRLLIPLPPVDFQRGVARLVSEAELRADELRAQARALEEGASHGVEAAFDQAMDSLFPQVSTKGEASSAVSSTSRPGG